MKKLNKVPYILKNVADKSVHFCKKNATTILSCVSSVGVVLTGVASAHSAKKACRKVISKYLDKWEITEEDLSPKERARIIFPYCIAPTLIGAATIVCIFGTNAISKKQQAVYISAYALLQSTFDEYKKKVEEMYGEEADEVVRAAIREDKYKGIELSFTGEKLVFYEENYGDFFERSMEEVLDAEYHINRNLALKGYVSLNEFLAFLDLPPVEQGGVLGWDLSIGSAYYGYNWIDFCHKKFTLDDGLEYILIDEPFPPHLDEDGRPFIDCDGTDYPQLAEYA